jgi:hypothetical protein
MLCDFHRWLNDDDLSSKEEDDSLKVAAGISSADAAGPLNGAAPRALMYCACARCALSLTHTFRIFVTLSDFILGLFDVGGEV